MQHRRPMTITTSSRATSSSSSINDDVAAECIISSASTSDDDDTLYFRCFGAFNDGHATTSAAAASAKHDVDHSNHTVRHPLAATTAQQWLHHSNISHPHYAHHHHPHHQTPTRDGTSCHHLWRTRTASSGCKSSLHNLCDAPPPPASCHLNETSVNSRSSDILETKTRTTGDANDCDRLNSVFQQIPRATTTTRCRALSPLSMTSWLAVLAICAASLQTSLAGKADGKWVA